MKLHPQPTPELQHLGTLLEKMSVAMLTTIGDDGVLLGCPIEALEMDAEGALWFFTDLRSELGERLRTSHLSFVDDQRGTYVSLSGRGEIDKDAARIERLWSAFDKVAFPDGPKAGYLGLLKFVPERAEYWDAPNSRAVRLLALAAAAVSGPTIGQTDHEVLTDLSALPGAAAATLR